MSDWVKFHRELCSGAKRGIPRALRFVYLELSLEARPRHGTIVLPVGMSDVDALQDAIGGNRKEIAEALKVFTSGSDPMIRFEDSEDGRLCIVTKWTKWNSYDVTAAERQAKRRAKLRELGGDNGGPDGGGHDGVTRDIDRDSDRDDSVTDGVTHGEITGSRARALLSSPSGSPSEDLSGGSGGGDAVSETRLRSGVVNQMADGAFGMAVTEWGAGIQSVTGKPFVLPRGAELVKLIDAFDAHCPEAEDRVTWARATGAAFAKARDGELLNAHRYSDWLGSNRPDRGGPKKAAPHVQATPPEGRHWTAGKGNDR